MGNLTVGRRVMVVPPHMAYRQTKTANIDKTHVEGKEQGRHGQPQYNQGKRLAKQRNLVKNDIGKAIGQGTNQGFNLLVKPLGSSACRKQRHDNARQ